ncbi:glutathione S-transferase family protein [Parahaliea mediterranea]|uniref:Glutathione S-transferase family protein n=1 Tax=Parahaliea mediterranea TaxID=651086 RepID=A0A939DCP2_9GAMM|nr:glutathione S-transferase family protein [Parahaliea mediterranea]MBN7795640.1 glutathione S-transferase family protein [Parahaliea mediterranea]
MGMLVDGQWRDVWYDTRSSGGQFVREDARFRHWVTADGGPGPEGEGGFAAEAGRYHLYVSLACPWAHRTLIMRELKDLAGLIDVSVVSPYMLEQGWSFDRAEGSTGDRVAGHDYHHQVYTSARPDYTGRVTVPVLWDRERATIVNNESAEILRMFNSAFDDLTGNTQDYYPADLRGDIDAWNARIYGAINNGVYRAGFATEQAAYEEAYRALFAELDHIDAHLGRHRYLAGDRLTEADIRLFTTLIRFDAVYHGHFKCNRQRLEDYTHLPGYVRDIYQLPGVAGTVDFHHIKTHYYGSHGTINPTGIVPAGPDIDYLRPHGRG